MHWTANVPRWISARLSSCTCRCRDCFGRRDGVGVRWSSTSRNQFFGAFGCLTDRDNGFSGVVAGTDGERANDAALVAERESIDKCGKPVADSVVRHLNAATVRRGAFGNALLARRLDLDGEQAVRVGDRQQQCAV